jgi:hypothetical protein
MAAIGIGRRTELNVSSGTAANTGRDIFLRFDSSPIQSFPLLAAADEFRHNSLVFSWGPIPYV